MLLESNWKGYWWLGFVVEFLNPIEQINSLMRCILICCILPRNYLFVYLFIYLFIYYRKLCANLVCFWVTRREQGFNDRYRQCSNSCWLADVLLGNINNMFHQNIMKPYSSIVGLCFLLENQQINSRPILRTSFQFKNCS